MVESTQKPGGRLIAIRSAAVVLGLIAWFGTQHLISGRGFPEGGIGDGVHEMTAPIHGWLTRNERAADALLVSSSFVIDALGVFVLGSALLGKSVRPFVAMLLVFAMRQACQAVCALPPPEGMIWRDPGVPSLLVTYGVSNDLFFSGHTAMAVLGASEVARLGAGRARGAKSSLILLGVALALFEVSTVLVLRAHYTMDVVAGALAALLASGASERLAPPVDRRLAKLAGKSAEAGP